jgi:tetratricopeptide (TPR) repeat protein
MLRLGVVLIAVLMCACAAPLSTAPAFGPSREWRECGGEQDASPEQRISSCTKVIESGREAPQTLALAFYVRGKAYAQKDQVDRAIQDFDEALRLDPDLPDAFRARGLAHANKGDSDRAIQDLDQAIRLNPNDTYAAYRRGVVYGNKGEYDRAIQDFDRAIRVNQQNADLFETEVLPMRRSATMTARSKTSTKRSGWTRRTRTASTSEVSPMSTRASGTTRSGITTKRSS